MELCDRTPSQRASHERLVISLGLGNSSLANIVSWLLRNHIRFVVDVRSLDKQSRNPRFRPDKVATALMEAGLDYVDLSSSLGERPGYRLHVLSREFSKALNEIVDLSRHGRVAIFCAEKDYKKCHRKVIASQLSRHGLRTRHDVLERGPPAPSQMTLEEVEKELSRPKMRLFTIGTSKKSMREFSTLLKACRIKRVVDVRLRPVSRYSSFARQDDLDYLLDVLGIEYFHIPELAPDEALLEKYRKDGDWIYYEKRFGDILEERHAETLIPKALEHRGNVCLLCAEDLPDRCHRRLVAEFARKQYPDLDILHATSDGVKRDVLDYR
jgi:uncharacterized protein (DUF488 family)